MAINIHGYKKYKCTGIDIFVNVLNFVPWNSPMFGNCITLKYDDLSWIWKKANNNV